MTRKTAHHAPPATGSPAAASLFASIDLPEGKSLEDVLDAVRAAVRAKYPMGSCYVEATDGQTVVVDCGPDGMFRHDWTMDAAGAVTLSAQAEKVVEQTTFKPVAASFRFAVVAAAAPRKLRIRAVGAGLGENSDAEGQWHVSPTPENNARLRKILGGARVHWHRTATGTYDHAQRIGPPKQLADWLGTDHDVGYLSDLAASDDGIAATLNLDDDVPADVVAALSDKRVGFSVECMAARKPVVAGGKRIAELTDFDHFPDRPASVAIVSHPALRGEVLSLAASRTAPNRRSTPMTIEEARALLASATATEEEKAKASAVVLRHENDELLAATRAAKVETDKMLLAAKVAGARAVLDTALAESKLPQESCDTIRDVFASAIEKGEAPAADAVAKQVERQRKILASQAGAASPLNVTVGAGPREKIALACERLLIGDADEWVQKRFAELAPMHKSGLVASASRGQLLASREMAAGIGYSDRAYSFRETFRTFTGKDIADIFRASGRERRSLAASINVAQFGDVFENVLNIAGMAYQESPRYSNWRKIVKVVPISGTLKQERAVTFGYANLPTVGEGDAYGAAVSPGDHGHGYTPSKRGYTEDWTMEAMLNDRIGALRDIVSKMAFAADRTKNDFVFDQLTILGMPTMDYDSVALFHASSHGANLLTSALTATSLEAARLAMLKQTDPSTSKRLSVTPRFLLVRDDLEKTAFDLVKPAGEYPGGSTSDNAWVRRMNLEVIPVTPTANGWDTVADWVLAADPNNGLVPTFEVGFEGGREMAEIFVQDMGNVGSMFERDVVTVAVKQPYMGGSPLRHEGFVINDV